MMGLVRLSPGDVFAGDFEIVRSVAGGGMGTIYEARDRTADRAVRALKILHPQLVADESSRRRFLQESRVASRVPSAHVPRVFRSGIDPVSGTPFISMELLVGRDLRQHIEERGAVGTEEALRIFGQVSEALVAAHRIGLVHRDLKPENIFLCDGEGPPLVKLLDFGVSKLIDVHRTSGRGTGAVGSPMWMAPEQTSAGGRIAPATDVWALGLTTFYALCGTIYWRAARGESGVAGLLREIHLDPIQRPSERARELGLSVALPAGYDDWFLRAMRRDGTERYADAGLAMDALRIGLDPSGADHSAAAFASTLAFESPVAPSAAARPTPALGGVTLDPTPSGEDPSAMTQRELHPVTEDADVTARDLARVEVPDTHRGLPRVQRPPASPAEPEVLTPPPVAQTLQGPPVSEPSVPTPAPITRQSPLAPAPFVSDPSVPTPAPITPQSPPAPAPFVSEPSVPTPAPIAPQSPPAPAPFVSEPSVPTPAPITPQSPFAPTPVVSEPSVPTPAPIAPQSPPAPSPFVSDPSVPTPAPIAPQPPAPTPLGHDGPRFTQPGAVPSAAPHRGGPRAGSLVLMLLVGACVVFTLAGALVWSFFQILPG